MWDSQYVVNTGTPRAGRIRHRFADEAALADPWRTDDGDDTPRAGDGFVEQRGDGIVPQVRPTSEASLRRGLMLADGLQPSRRHRIVATLDMHPFGLSEQNDVLDQPGRRFT